MSEDRGAHSSVHDDARRARRELEGKERKSARACLTTGVVFGLLALVCVADALVTFFSTRPLDEVAWQGATAVFWGVFAAALIRLGVGDLARLGRDAHLRRTGLRGRGTVLRYVTVGVAVDGATQHDLTLRVELAGRAPWETTVSERVLHGTRIAEGKMLPVLVDASNPRVLIVDWESFDE